MSQYLHRPASYKGSSYAYQSSFEFPTSSRSPMQTVTVTEEMPCLGSGDYRVGRKAERLSLNLSEGVKRSTSREPTPRFTSVQQRAFHVEPYPPSASLQQEFLLSEKSDQILPLASPPASSNFPRSPSPLQKFYDSRLLWLALYFVFNLGLTLYNKIVLVRFPFPYTLTAVHALFGALGSWLLAYTGVHTPSKLSRKQFTVLLIFSSLYTINIAVSNLSLQLVTIPFHQVVRAATPIFVIVLSAVFFGKSSSSAKIAALIPVIMGVAIATYGDYYFTTWGLLLTLLGTLLAALKTIFTNVLQSPSKPLTASQSQSSHPSALLLKISRFSPTTLLSNARLQLHPLDLLNLLSPLAFIQCLILAQLTGEMGKVQVYFVQEMTRWKLFSLALNGCIAFGLNVVSFSANKKVGALGITVAANVKQVLTILIAVFLFNLTITPMNMGGILLTLMGGAWYARVEYIEKEMKRKATQGVSCYF
ncbi:hypothetical protein D9758_009410 [Tetrapyrgos nigripes]|uniref:Sugar phosphate transporter domain-containing protein n=1 Tax=Tetrapyrgos nigripes TaxID=182062 RepID=A0A8H5D2J2_9AGAR|nr:hypothetical protein D9758_009410 [Tetrapyrgos nigripes]